MNNDLLSNTLPPFVGAALIEEGTDEKEGQI
jgi:hypothetical protein